MVLNYIFWDPDPFVFHLGTISVRWYGLFFAISFVLGYIVMHWIFRKEDIPMRILDQLATVVVVSAIIGARLGHCIFYEPTRYLGHPIEILKIWEGGLASHGGGTGMLMGLFFFSLKKRISYIWILDRIVIVVALAGFFIRMGNLMNSEIVGKPTGLPWGFVFLDSVDRREMAVPRHPAQIYEAIAYLAIFGYLLWYYIKNNARPKQGFLFSQFLIMVFSVRFIIEFIKEPQVSFERSMIINMGQLLSIPFILAGIALLLFFRQRALKSSQPAGP